MPIELNRRAAGIAQQMLADAAVLRIQQKQLDNNARIIDCGNRVPGGLEAGRRLAECCMAGLGAVHFETGRNDLWPGPAVVVRTDHPVAACMAAQYAGWEIKVNDFFAMGSGPMRAAAAREELFGSIGLVEKADMAVGILETASDVDEAVADYLAEACNVAPSNLLLLVARTASQAGNVQIVARSVETTMHKLSELRFDLSRVLSGFGTAPLPPVAANDLTGIGRTNDSILYGAEVTLTIQCDDKDLLEIGPQIPSNSSPDHGEPFQKIFSKYGNDFYQIDRHLFSPAVVTLNSALSGRSYRFGELGPEVIHQSFSGTTA